jgi:hypothetical protein
MPDSVKPHIACTISDVLLTTWKAGFPVDAAAKLRIELVTGEEIRACLGPDSSMVLVRFISDSPVLQSQLPRNLWVAFPREHLADEIRVIQVARRSMLQALKDQTPPLTGSSEKAKLEP